MYIDNLLILIPIYTYIHTGSLLHTLTGHLGVVRCLHINEFRLVSGGDQKKINVWDYRVCIKTIIQWTTGCVLIQNHFMEYRVCIKTKAWMRVCIKWTTGCALKQIHFRDCFKTKLTSQGIQGVYLKIISWTKGSVLKQNYIMGIGCVLQCLRLQGVY